MKELILVVMLFVLAIYGLFQLIKTTTQNVLKLISKYRKKKGDVDDTCTN